MATSNFGDAPRWFIAAASAVLLWEIFGCTMYMLQMTADQASLPLEQAAVWEATPEWSIAAYAIAVWIGLAGAVLLLMRRRLAEPLLLISLLAVLVQFSSHLLIPALREVTPARAWVMPVGIVIVCTAIWLFARRARARGWLR